MKKNKYSTPEIVIENLIKQDVLLASGPNEKENPDNIEKSLLDFDSWWD